jgi:hypothetical protein
VNGTEPRAERIEARMTAWSARARAAPIPSRADLPADHDRGGRRAGQPVVDGGREGAGGETGQPGGHGHRGQDGQQQAGRQQRRGPGAP